LNHTTRPNCALASTAPAVLRSLKRLVEPELEVVAMCDNLVSLTSAIVDLRPGLIVTDRLAQGDVVRLATRFRGTGVIALVEDDTSTEPLLEAGVSVVRKLDAAEELPDALRAVQRGERYDSPTLSEGEE
jgi:hypothetical protein